MTISKYIIEFLKEYYDISIETNHVADGSDKYGLFKSPARDLSRNIDGCYIITENYQFFAKQSSISDYERKDSDEWLEEFTYWVDDYGLENEYPDLDGDRRVIDIQATGNPNPMYDTDDEITYSISLSITYEREAV